MGYWTCFIVIRKWLASTYINPRTRMNPSTMSPNRCLPSPRSIQRERVRVRGHCRSWGLPPHSRAQLGVSPSKSRNPAVRPALHPGAHAVSPAPTLPKMFVTPFPSLILDNVSLNNLWSPLPLLSEFLPQQINDRLLFYTRIHETSHSQVLDRRKI